MHRWRLAKRRMLLSAALFLGASGCTQVPPPQTFVLLTIDTLRADRLGVYGHPSGTSPAIDRLARKSVTLETCVSVSSWTMPSMGTLATGLHPNEHGLMYWHMPLQPVSQTLAENLKERGFTTAFIGNPIPALQGLDRGFDLWTNHDGDDFAALEEALAWIERTRGENRFLWLHLLAPHAPYDPIPELQRNEEGVPLQTLRYEAEVRTVDRIVQRLMSELDEDSAIWLSSDHGETLTERDEIEYDHGKFLYEELLRVPSIAFVPGFEPRTISTTTQLADIPTTIARILGAREPKGAYGRSLVSLLRNGEGRAHDPVFSLVIEDDPPVNKAQRWAVRSDDWKAVFTKNPQDEELYDLRSDGRERYDVSDEHPEELERRRRLLDDWLEDAPKHRIPFNKRFSPEALERLQAVGYLGGSGH